jgi:hypothetical protein
MDKPVFIKVTGKQTNAQGAESPSASSNRIELFIPLHGIAAIKGGSTLTTVYLTSECTQALASKGLHVKDLMTEFKPENAQIL